MAISIGNRNIGPTVALSVGAASTASVSLATYTNEPLGYAAFMNTGPNPVAISTSGQAVTPSAVLPTPGAPQNVIMLAANMTGPLVYVVPTNCSLTAIGTAVGPATVYITPVLGQS